ncbi:hypothetical protein [Actinoplanes sp. NPDC020271]|uniref:hypothetical protein n=1 Tax=Actinoplanes sp. NPDC020271 TaxID=3363896 RepID=UPI0037BCE32C
MSIVIDGIQDGEWEIRPDHDEVELVFLTGDRRYVAWIPVEEMPIVDRLLAEIADPPPGERLDLSAAFVTALGRDPFTEQPAPLPWYRRLVRRR